jgi:4-amino-4-deoxy-L-arabinose transferase-like glycosyltransferase
METSWRWSGRILEGDVLSREPTHPYPSWMAEIAPVERWARWWGGRHVFFRAPLYAYLLAGMRLVAGDGFWGIALCQMALALGGVALAFVLAERVFGTPAALVAGLGSALYGPSLLHEPLLLRDPLAVTCTLAMLWALLRAPDGGPRRWFLAGLAFAACTLARETTGAFAPFVVLWAVQRLRARAAALALGGFLGGALLGLSPLALRNVAVGVTPWALSSRGVEEFVIGHAAGPGPAGLGIPPATGRILLEADGRLLPAMRLTLASYAGDWRTLARRERDRLRAIVSRYEPADNVSWTYFATRSAALRWSLRFDVVLALGLVGLCVPGRRADDRIVRYFLLTSLAGLLYATVVGRYRLVPAAVLWVYAGGAVAWMGRALARADWRGAMLPAVAAGVLLAISVLSLREVEREQRWRAAEFLLASGVYRERGELDRAFEELREGLATAYRAPEQRTLPWGYNPVVRDLVGTAHDAGRDGEAVAELERLARDYPADANVQGLLGALRREPGRPAQALGTP